MEWAKETAKDAANSETAEWATDTAKSATNTVTGTGGSNGGAGDTAYEATKDTASEAYETATDYVPDVTSEDTTATAVLNSAPFRSFKPDDSTVWKGHIIYILLAAGCTIPWWTFLCAVDYFQLLYPGTHIIRYITFVYYGSWLIAYGLVVSFWRQGTSWIKINLGLGVSVVALALIPFLEIFIDTKGSTATFWVTLVIVAIAGAADAVSQGSLLGVASELPGSFTKAYIDGAAFSGVFAFIIRVITKASFSSSDKGLKIGSIVYFCVVILLPILAVALFAYVHNMPEMSYYNSLNLGSLDTMRLLIQDQDSVTLEVAAGAAIASVAAGRESTPKPLQWGAVLEKNKMLSLAMFITSLVTLSIFPGMLLEDAPQWSGLGDFAPVLLVGIFVIFDQGGRLFTAKEMTTRQRTVFGTAWFRLILVALFVLAFLFDTSFLLFSVLTALLGISNGYLIATLTVLVPKANSSYLAESASILNALIMTVGFLVGAGLGWVWVRR